MKTFNFNIEAEGELDIDSLSKEQWIKFKDDLKAVFDNHKLDILALYVYDIVDPKDMTDEEKTVMAIQTAAKKIALSAMSNAAAHNLKSSNAYVIPNTSKLIN